MTRLKFPAVILASFLLLAGRNGQAFGLFDTYHLLGSRNERMVSVIGVGSYVSYRGRVDSVHLLAPEFYVGYQAPQCRAVVVTDDQKTVTVTTDSTAKQPTIQYFHNAVGCDALQAAFSEGWKVSVTGVITAMGSSDPSSIVMSRIQTGPEGPAPTLGSEAGSGASFYSCAYPTCTPEGTVVSFNADLINPEFLCQATLKTTPANDGTSQVAAIYVQSTKQIPDSGTGEIQALSLFHGKYSMCSGFLRSLTDGRAITAYVKAEYGRLDVTTMDRTSD